MKSKKSPFPFFFVARVKKGNFILFWFRDIAKNVHLPGEYELLKDLTTEEIGQILGGN